MYRKDQETENVSQNNHIVLKSRAFSFENNHKVYRESQSFYHRLVKMHNLSQLVFKPDVQLKKENKDEAVMRDSRGESDGDGLGSVNDLTRSGEIGQVEETWLMLHAKGN